MPEDTPPYEPEPIETSREELSGDILQLTEILAKNSHDIWARQRMADGWRFGLTLDEVRKRHPSLVPYERLPESEKEYDRNAALDTLKVLTALGYRIVRVELSPSRAGVEDKRDRL